MKLCIAGCRDHYATTLEISEYLHDAGIDINDITCIVSGKAPGVDSMGEKFAEKNDIPVVPFKAEWTKYKPLNPRNGNPAGPIRNAKMADYCDMALLIWDGVSPGTKNMMEALERRKKPYFLVKIKRKDAGEWHNKT